VEALGGCEDVAAVGELDVQPEMDVL